MTPAIDMCVKTDRATVAERARLLSLLHSRPPVTVRGTHAYAAVLVLCCLGLVLVAWGASGCAAAPDYTPERARVLGSVLLDTPSGDVLVELDTGLVIGPSEAGVTVKQIRVYSEVEAPAGLVSVDYTTGPADSEWRHCVQATVTLSGWVVQRRWGCTLPEVATP